ncbi:arylesterase [Pseudoroseicyclus aestuarii]|uniref:arylesterase n=1 Tax=Pseudoroseicyclus aestuarii TaxID=1795041 RepID=UPI003CCC5EF2
MARLPGYGAPALRSKLAGLALLLGAPLAASAQQVTVAALGDSLTAGYGLPQDAGFVPVLQDWLDARGADADLVNAGVSGDTTAGGLARLDWTLTEDVDALMVNLGGNDFLRGLDPAEVRANLSAILGGAAERDLPVLLVGIEATANYGAEYQARFNAVYADLAQEYEVLYYPSFFAPLTAGGDLDDARQRYMQDDGIHPNAEGVTLIVEAIGPSVEALVDEAREGL